MSEVAREVDAGKRCARASESAKCVDASIAPQRANGLIRRAGRA